MPTREQYQKVKLNPDFAKKHAAYDKKWTDENKDRVRAIEAKGYAKNRIGRLAKMKNYVTLNKDKIIDYKLKYGYGLSLEDYNAMFAAQEGKCAVCNKHQAEFKKALAVDHNHKNGKIRALLCNHCNTALGLLLEDKILILKLAKYVEKHELADSIAKTDHGAVSPINNQIGV